MSSPLHTAERPWSAGAPVPRDGRLLGTPSEGPCPRHGRDELVSLLEQAGLTGRGGAGFPTARKLAGVSSQRSRPVVVGNAMEGEELSRKDEALLQLNPALVLDGLDVLSHAVGARRTVLAIGSQIDTRAVRAEAGSRRSPVEVLSFPDAFVAGQESALVNRINNRAAIPSDPLRPVWQHGVDGRPTMVTNAETLAQLALVVRYGPGWFRDAGTQADPGTFLTTVSGSSRGIVTNPGVVEIAHGTRLLDLLKVCGTDLDSIGGILVGGYHGGWLPPAALDVPLSREGLAELALLDRLRQPLPQAGGGDPSHH